MKDHSARDFEYGPSRYEAARAAEEQRRQRKARKKQSAEEEVEDRDPFEEAEQLLDDSDRPDSVESAG